LVFKKGNAPWNKNKKGLQIAHNKGKTKENYEPLQRSSETLKKYLKNNPRIGKKNPFYGKFHTTKTKQKISKGNTGNTACNKGLLGYMAG